MIKYIHKDKLSASALCFSFGWVFSLRKIAESQEWSSSALQIPLKWNSVKNCTLHIYQLLCDWKIGGSLKLIWKQTVSTESVLLNE